MLSIVIPAHNERRNLERLIPYLEGLTSPKTIEIIVALSCTTDDGSDLLTNPPRVRVMRCEGIGRALQMNAAVKMARGSILIFLHADVVPPLSFFQDIVDTLDRPYKAGFFSYKFDTDSALLRLNARFTSKDGIFTGGGDQCLFIEKALFLELGGYNEQQLLMEDFEFFDRMKKHKIPYRIIKNDLIVSARKYQSNSYLRVNLSNLLLMVLFKLGCSSRVLKTLHNRLLNGYKETIT